MNIDRPGSVRKKVVLRVRAADSATLINAILRRPRCRFIEPCAVTPAFLAGQFIPKRVCRADRLTLGFPIKTAGQKA